MKPIILVLAASLAIGLGLAFATGWIVRPAWIGLAIMIGSALLVRRHWQRPTPCGPGSPERALWIGMAGSTQILGYLLTTLWRVGPSFEVHSAGGHRLGIDTWTFVLGMVLAFSIARDPDPRSDERDVWISARGRRSSFHCLSAVLVLLIVGLGFGFLQALSQAMVAHLLIATLLLAWLVDYLVQLVAYAQDHAAESQRS